MSVLSRIATVFTLKQIFYLLTHLKNYNFRLNIRLPRVICNSKVVVYMAYKKITLSYGIQIEFNIRCVTKGAPWPNVAVCLLVIHSDLFYLRVVDVEGYCCPWSHTHARTHTHTHTQTVGYACMTLPLSEISTRATHTALHNRQTSLSTAGC